MSAKVELVNRIRISAEKVVQNTRALEADIMEMESSDNAVMVQALLDVGAGVIDMLSCIALAVTAGLPNTVPGRGDGKI